MVGAINSSHGAINSSQCAINSLHGAINSSHGAINSSQCAINNSQGAINSSHSALNSSYGAINSSHGGLHMWCQWWGIVLFTSNHLKCCLHLRYYKLLHAAYSKKKLSWQKNNNLEILIELINSGLSITLIMFSMFYQFLTNIMASFTAIITIQVLIKN